MWTFIQLMAKRKEKREKNPKTPKLVFSLRVSFRVTSESASDSDSNFWTSLRVASESAPQWSSFIIYSGPIFTWLLFHSLFSQKKGQKPNLMESLWPDHSSINPSAICPRDSGENTTSVPHTGLHSRAKNSTIHCCCWHKSPAICFQTSKCNYISNYHHIQVVRLLAAIIFCKFPSYVHLCIV